MVNKYRKTHLLDKESRGGEISQAGFNFQTDYILSRIPIWLQHDGFESFIHEATGDVEAKFFIPGFGTKIEYSEVKDHNVTPTEFWKEIKYFLKIHKENPHSYHRFSLVAPSYSEKVMTILNSLKRIQGTVGFYQTTVPLMGEAIESFIHLVEKGGHMRGEALLILEKVTIQIWPKEIVSFENNIASIFPNYSELPQSKLFEVKNELSRLVYENLSSSVSRKSIEKILSNTLGVSNDNFLKTTIFTAAKDEDFHEKKALVFNWRRFWGGSERKYPDRGAWGRMISDLVDAREWILKNRSTRRILVTGTRRLSSAMAIGLIFSAVEGFNIELEYREGKPFSTSKHSKETKVNLMIDSIQKNCDELAVIISLNKDITKVVKQYLGNILGQPISTLIVRTTNPISSSAEANFIVRRIKDEINKLLPIGGSSKIHLFINGPSYIALFLGHRLNALPPIQCYEWIGGSDYIPTCILD